MPSKYDFTEIKDADNILKEITFMPSTIENIDTAIYNHIRDELALRTTTNKGNVAVEADSAPKQVTEMTSFSTIDALTAESDV